jgi:FAD/FMN-containing dehydrogenase
VLQTGRRRLGASLCAFEVMWGNYVDEVRRRLPQVRIPPLETSAFVVLLEIESSGNAQAALESFLTDLSTAGAITDGVVAQSQSQAESFWALRDAISQLLTLYKHSLAFDISLPLTAMAAYCTEVERNLAAALPGVTALCFGHLGDGTLHYILDLPDESGKTAALDAVLTPLTAYGGAVSAEHGIGVAKRDYLQLCRSAADIETMRQLKKHFDPHGLLNPGRVIALQK